MQPNEEQMASSGSCHPRCGVLSSVVKRHSAPGVSPPSVQCLQGLYTPRRVATE